MNRSNDNRTPSPQPAMPNRGGGFRPLGMPVEKPKNFKATLRRLAGYFKPQLFRLTIVFLTAVVSTVFSIVSPKVMGNATTKLYDGVVSKVKGLPGSGVDFHALFLILVVLAILYVVSAAFSYLQQYVMAGVAQETVYAMRNQVNEKLARLPLEFFDGRPQGDIMSRFVNDFDNIGNTLQQTITQLISSVITFVGVIVMMLTISPLMTLVVFLTLPLSFVVTKQIAMRSQKHFKGQQRYLGLLNGHVEEMYTGHQVVKAFGREEQSIARFDEWNDLLYESGWKAQFISGIIWPLMNFIGNIGYVLVAVIGGIMVTRGAIQIGDIQAFIQYARQFSQPITQLSSISNVIQSTIASAERVFEILDAAEEVPEVAHPVVLNEIEGDVQFSDVDFSYHENTPLIQGMNVRVRPGQTIAIVGPTGAGKTTLVNLLMRFYEVNGGGILVDGVNITDIRRKDLRHIFGMVLQDTWLFHGTIHDNIAYGREGATDEEVVEAARAARADHFIRTLPDGYETILNEEASNISQGQKQLLTIARAILANPSILILDEATSSVDTRTEVFIQEALQTLMQGRTSFVIAHRLSTIKDADLILVMNHGTIIEQGTHESLLLQNGFYADLYNSQFTTGAVEAAV